MLQHKYSYIVLPIQITSDHVNTKASSNRQQDNTYSQAKAAAASIEGHAAGALGLGATAK